MEAAIRAMMEFYKIDRPTAIRLMQKSGFQHKDLLTDEQKAPYGADPNQATREPLLGPTAEITGAAGGVGKYEFGRKPEIELGEATVTSLSPPTLGPQPAKAPEFQPIQESKLDTMMRLAQLAAKQQMIPSTLAPPPAPKDKASKPASAPGKKVAKKAGPSVASK